MMKRCLSRAGGLALLLLLSGACLAGPWRAGANNSAGWQFMNPDERVEHQRRMRGFTRYDECKAYQAEHHALMAERARKAGVVLEPHEDSGCEQLRARGQFQ